MAELNWIRKLQTPYPLGLNDNIYHEGNISQNPDIDIFNISDIIKRKRRSHGIRINHNIKRKHNRTISLSDLNKIYKSSGRHSLLSKLTGLSLSNLRDIDTEADAIYIQLNPLYDVACIVQSYTQHILRPHIDDISDHKRHFLKISYINKGIDFIDFAGVLRDKRVVNEIPKYFKNSETPVICYKYKRPIRALLFNYNKVVSDLKIDTSTPTECSCSESKFCYQPAGHVVTGDFSIVKDKRIRNLLFKGPKYRLPSEIDFAACRDEISEAVDVFSRKWIKREFADAHALVAWKKMISKLIETRIQFYIANPSLLPSKPTFSFRHLKKGIQDFHSRFVLVPADKCSNNVIVV